MAQEVHLLGAFTSKLAALNVQHQITSTDVFHDKVDTRLRLKAGMEIQQEGVSLFVGDQENSLLGFGTLDLVVFNDEFLFQNLDGIQFLGGLRFCKHDFAKVTLTKYSEEIEML